MSEGVSGKHSYRVSFVDARGRIASEVFEAASPEEAHVLVKDRGRILGCAALSRTSTWDLKQWFVRTASAPKAAIDTVSFSQDLSTLLEAGVSVKVAIGVLYRKEAHAAHRRTLADLVTSISQGLALSAALKSSGAFPELLVATVAASERTGDLATGLTRYAKHQQSLQLVRDRVIGACVYPLLLLIVGSLVVALLLGVVVPRFATLIDTSGKELPLLSRLLMQWGGFIDQNSWAAFALLGCIAGALLAGFLRYRNPQKRRNLLRKLPGMAKLMREFQHLQMYRTTGILTSRGIAIHKAFGYSMEYLDSDDQQRLQVALQDMSHGVGVSDALSKCGLADAVASSMMSVAERTGSMPEMLDRIADFYERTLQRSIDIVSRLIEPVLMIIFGIVIGGIVVLMYLPIFDLASSIS